MMQRLPLIRHLLLLAATLGAAAAPAAARGQALDGAGELDRTLT